MVALYDDDQVPVARRLLQSVHKTSELAICILYGRDISVGVHTEANSKVARSIGIVNERFMSKHVMKHEQSWRVAGKRVLCGVQTVRKQLNPVFFLISQSLCNIIF